MNLSKENFTQIEFSGGGGTKAAHAANAGFIPAQTADHEKVTMVNERALAAWVPCVQFPTIQKWLTD